MFVKHEQISTEFIFVLDIVRRWRTLETQTTSQQQDCHELYVLHVDRVRIERDLGALKHTVSFDKFDDVHEVEVALRTVQVSVLSSSSSSSHGIFKVA